MLHDLPVIDIEDLIRILNGGQPVGDDEGGPPLEQVGQSGLEGLLGASVDAAGRLVQNQDSGVGR